MIYPYIPHTDADRRAMLKAIGVESIDELFSGLGADLLLEDSIPISHGRTEDEVQRMINSIAQRNVRGIPFLGCGCYDHITPATVKALSSLPSFVTAYTPYQAEMSQGLLQAIYEFQSMICEITGLDVANASLYDGANAAVEAASLMLAAKRKSRVVLVSETIHPFALKVLTTWALGTEHTITLVPQQGGIADFEVLPSLLSDEVAGLIVQTPNCYGLLEDYTGIADLLHANGSLLAISADPLSLAIQKSQAEWGGHRRRTQPSGFAPWRPPGYWRWQALLRRCPGVVGATVDKEGRGYADVQAGAAHQAGAGDEQHLPTRPSPPDHHPLSLGWGGMVGRQSRLRQGLAVTCPLPGSPWCGTNRSGASSRWFNDAKKMRSSCRSSATKGSLPGGSQPKRTLTNWSCSSR